MDFSHGEAVQRFDATPLNQFPFFFLFIYYYFLPYG